MGGRWGIRACETAFEHTLDHTFDQSFDHAFDHAFDHTSALGYQIVTNDPSPNNLSPAVPEETAGVIYWSMVNSDGPASQWSIRRCARTCACALAMTRIGTAAGILRWALARTLGWCTALAMTRIGAAAVCVPAQRFRIGRASKASQAALAPRILTGVFH